MTFGKPQLTSRRVTHANLTPESTGMETSSTSAVEREENRRQLRQNALAAWSHDQTTDLHTTSREADRWLAKPEGGKKIIPPKCPT